MDVPGDFIPVSEVEKHRVPCSGREKEFYDYGAEPGKRK